VKGDGFMMALPVIAVIVMCLVLEFHVRAAAGRAAGEFCICGAGSC
jgi:hypothetical protein